MNLALLLGCEHLTQYAVRYYAEEEENTNRLTDVAFDIISVCATEHPLIGSCVMSGILTKELATYRLKKDDLLAKYPGKYVLIQGDEVKSAWDTYDDALQAGYDAFGVTTPFLVKKVEAMEYVHFNSRSIRPACHQ